MLTKGEFEGSVKCQTAVLHLHRIRGNGLSLQERFKVDIRKNFQMVRAPHIGIHHCGKWWCIHPCG